MSRILRLRAWVAVFAATGLGAKADAQLTQASSTDMSGRVSQSWQYQGRGYVLSGQRTTYPTPYYVQQRTAYTQPTQTYYVQQPQYPVSPGGIVTGNPTPSYDPNTVVSGNSGGTVYWDPYRGWVTIAQTTSVLNSATSTGREVMQGGSVQYYNYWDGSRWVRGSRWLGQDGQWHGNHVNTTVAPNGSSHTSQLLYAPRPR